MAGFYRMYIPPLIDENGSVHDNHILYEKTLVDKLQLSNGNVLDLGCGSGRISDHISELTDCEVYGINISPTHIETGKRYAKKKHNNKVHYSVASFNDPLTFREDYFNAAYDLGSIIYSYDLLKTFKEIYRVLKPGGRYLTLSPLLMDNFDKNNMLHLYNVNSCRMFGEWTYGAHYKYFEKIGKEAGFNIISSKPAGNIAGTYRKLLQCYHYYYVITEILTKCKLVPSYIKDILKSMSCMEIKQCIEAESNKLCTVSYEVIFEKPL